jgi:putative SOS response-associated peptidase YedK
MPVILEEQDWRAWLGEVPRDPVELFQPAAEGIVDAVAGQSGREQR